MTTAMEQYVRHVNPEFVRLLGILGYGRVFVRAQDVWVWDDQGRRYLDFLAGFGAVNIGHNHPRIAKRLHDFLESGAIVLNHVGLSVEASELAAALAELTPPLEMASFANSGSEAVENGMKLARAATRRERFVFCDGAYHGTTFGALSLMGRSRLRKPFEPLLADCVRVPFGDIDALKSALETPTAGFIIEPIQCEGGVRIPPSGYLRDAQDLCRRRGTVMILDEVQTGLGRTGTMFAYQAEGFVPDVLVLAKSLGAAISPISATITRRDIREKAFGSIDRFDGHSSTFGGNAFSAVAALETLRVITDEKLIENSAQRGAQLLAGLQSRLSGHPMVRDIRGRGLLVGIQLGPADPSWWKGVSEKISDSVFGHWVALKLLERGILCQPSANRHDVLRLEPPLTVKPGEVECVIDAVAEVLAEYGGVSALVKDVVVRMGEQFLRGGEFR